MPEDFDVKEKRFEQDIEEYLTGRGHICEFYKNQSA